MLAWKCLWVFFLIFFFLLVGTVSLNAAQQLRPAVRIKHFLLLQPRLSRLRQEICRSCTHLSGKQTPAPTTAYHHCYYYYYCCYYCLTAKQSGLRGGLPLTPVMDWCLFCFFNENHYRTLVEPPGHYPVKNGNINSAHKIHTYSQRGLRQTW